MVDGPSVADPDDGKPSKWLKRQIARSKRPQLARPDSVKPEQEDRWVFGMGEGAERLFVYGDRAAVNAVEKLQAEVERLRALLQEPSHERTVRLVLKAVEAERAPLLAVVEAAKEWRTSKEWAAQNAGKLLKSSISGNEAAEIMREYFSKEEALIAAVDA